MDDIIAAIAVLLTLDDTLLQRGLGASVSSSVQMGQMAGETFARQFGLQAGRGLGAFAGTLGQLVGPSVSGNIGIGLLGAVRSIGTAAVSSSAELGLYQNQLEEIEKSAGRAASATNTAAAAVNDLGRLSAATPFSNQEVFGIALQEAGRTQNVSRAAANTQLLVDAAASLGVQRNTFERFARNLPDLRLQTDRPANLRDIKELQRIAPFAPARLAPILGVRAEEVDEKIRSITGAELFAALQKLGQQNSGLAASQALQDMRNAPDILSESFKQSLAPTGDILNSILGPAATSAFNLVNNFGELNKATKGAAGLFLLATGAVVGTRAIYGATLATLRFTAALNVAALRAAAGGAGDAVAASAGGAAASAGKGATAGLAARLAPFLIPLMIPIVAVAVAGAAGGAIGIATGDGKDPFMDLLLGSGRKQNAERVKKIFPGLAGLETKAALENTAPEKTKANEDLKKAADNLNSAAKSLNDVVGGKERTMRATQLLQLEFAGSGLVNAQLGRSAITGIG